jgi:hypothetical protein
VVSNGPCRVVIQLCPDWSRLDKYGGINGKIDPLSDSDDLGEEVIYSQESPKMEESFKDFNWDLNRFVEYRSPFTRKETLPIKKPI